MRKPLLFVTGLALAIYLFVAIKFHVQLLFGEGHVEHWEHYAREWFNLLTIAACFVYLCLPTRER